ncbi:MAG: VanZ family protein [Gammaproteobacteria bacterium]
MAAWRTLAWAAVAAVAAVSLMSTPPLAEELPSFTDKLVHAGMYGALALLFRRAYPARGMLGLGLALACYGAGLEFVQGLTPDRSTSFADAIANCAGISIILALEAARTRRRTPVVNTRP